MFRHCTRIFCNLHLRHTFANNTFAPAKCMSSIEAQKVAGYTFILRSCSTGNDIQNKKESVAVDVSPKNKYEQKLEQIKADPTLNRKFQLLQLEVDVRRSSGCTVPANMKAVHWVQLFESTSKSEKSRLLHFFWLNERHKAKSERSKNMKKLKEQERLDDLHTDIGSALSYGLGHNSIFMRIYDKNMHKVYHKRMLNALMFGSKVVFDFGYTQYMSMKEIRNSAKQLGLAYAGNKIHSEPFYWYFCNVDKSDKLMELVKQLIPTIMHDVFPITITSDPPTSVCDRKKLVYLTPDSPNVLQEYNPHDIYIIGAYVDKHIHKPYSLDAAKKYNVRHAKLPLDLLDWGDCSARSLTINQVHDILLDINVSRDWIKAFKHVPHRKLKNAEDRRAHFKAARDNYKLLRSIQKISKNNTNMSDNNSSIDTQLYRK